MGVINNLIPGSSHGLHIYEYSDILLLNKTNTENRKYNNYLFKHYNPYQKKHSCPNNLPHQEYHLGDLGNIIADNTGQAKFSIIKKISAKSLGGRVIVVNKRKDNCDKETEYDDGNNIYAFGVLGVIRALDKKEDYLSNGKDENFMKEINSINEASKERRLKEENERKKNQKEKKKAEENNQAIQNAFEAAPLKIELPKREPEQETRINLPDKNTNVESSNVNPSSNSLFNFLTDNDNTSKVSSDNEVLQKTNDLSQLKENKNKSLKLSYRKIKDMERDDSEERYVKHKKKSKKLFNDYGYDNMNKKNKKEEQDEVTDEENTENEEKSNNSNHVKEDSSMIPVLTQLNNKLKKNNENTDDNIKVDILQDRNDRDLDVDNLFINSKFRQIEENNKLNLINKGMRLLNPFEINFIQTNSKNPLNNKSYKESPIQRNKRNNENLHLIGRNKFDPFELIKFKESEILSDLKK